MAQNQQQHINNSWPVYRSNFPRHVLGVNTYLQADVMDSLLARYGHSSLKLSFEPYISLIALREMNLNPIAAALGISKQAANKTANQLEDAGYIRRIQANGDKRARLLALTAKGKALIRDGLSAYQVTEKKLSDAAPECNLASLSTPLAELAEKLDLIPISLEARQTPLPFGSVLARFADYISARLMALTAKRGHPNLKLSYAHILSNVGPNGVRMQDISRVRKISKQAVSAIARELESLGYIRREAENGNGRQQLLHFTDLGTQLISDSVASMQQLEDELSPLIGSRRFSQLKQGMRSLYDGLELEREEFGNLYEPEMNRLAQSLIDELGKAKAQSLAQILLSQ